MEIELYSLVQPSGRCLMLGKILSDVVALPPKECLCLAEELFNYQYTNENPVKIRLKDGVNIEELKTICKDFQIEFRIRE